MKEYEISTKTIQEIIDKVPKDKWFLVIDEMKKALEQFTPVIDMINEIGKTQNVGLSYFPDTLTWVDDGKCENTLIIEEPDGQSLSIVYGNKP